MAMAELGSAVLGAGGSARRALPALLLGCLLTPPN